MYRRLWLAAALSVASALFTNLTASAATLSTASLSLSDPRPAFNSNYKFTASGISLTGIQCIEEVFSTAAGGTTVPSGMVTTSATLDASTNYVTPGSLTVNATTNGTVKLTSASALTPANAGPLFVQLDGILNSSTADTGFYMTFSTYTNANCSTGPVDNATVQFINTNGSTLTLTVNDILAFTVNAVATSQTCDGATTTAASTSTTIPFGTVNSAANAVVCQQLSAATNATNGYTIYVRETAAPTNALGQTIASVSGSNTTPSAFPAAGTEAYGYSTNDAALSTCGGTCSSNRFTSPAQGWAAMTTSNAEIGYEPNGVSSSSWLIGHQVGVSTTTHPGTYTTTIIYTCTPVY